MIIASGLLALIVGGAFLVLLIAVDGSVASTERARRADAALVEANRVERLVIDLETGQRGFVLTGDERFLEPWHAARDLLPEATAELKRSAADSPGEAGARQLIDDVTSYIDDYSVPLVEAATRRDPTAASVASTLEGKRRVDELRGAVDRLLATEQSDLERNRGHTDASIRRAIAVAAGSLAGSILLIVFFATYLTRAIVGPIRRAAVMADRLAGGDLGSRMMASGPAEIGDLERSFNVMADSLQRDRDELSRLAEEQAALRRVATLVANAAPAAELFAAVSEEVGRLLPVDITSMNRYGSDGTATVVAGWDRSGRPVLVGARHPLEGANLSTIIAQTRRPARIDFADSSGGLVAAAKEAGARSGIGTPIVVAGRLWGVMVAASTSQEPLPEDTEARLAGFTDLVATAIANAESRTELAASRARVVEAADVSRRRIERDLHDGAQQRLISLGLDLRAAESAVPVELPELRTQLSRAAEGLTEVLEDVQEISRGIHPAILSKGGLGPAVRTLARRCPVRVELDVGADQRLPERIEAAAYYVISEALTNAAKHAHASVVRVTVHAEGAELQISISDDGIGGADPSHGSGLIGLRDRVEAFGGTFEIASPARSGTSLLVTLPIVGT
jgi:signal transduction histidine kinase